ncbi:MAG: secondary thiamine-phosphate synthase enzyme YjbQ [Candidatus Aenigmarchaeota archaeon]|nr:secondary thiamine-phosphate synthase enzyme YjbQ [Candidatus Aenigmarchaeota archaeon]MDW8149282.1 secondary thiamine-phosphate synthase enzyme YjbQ [Candidatus Aenigmarchaeota archaeon]
MEIFFEEIKIESKEKYEIIDITNYIEKAIDKSKIKNGICFIFTPHATCCLIANENENYLKEDIIKKIKEEFENNWKHNLIDDNASSHLASSFIKQFLIYPIKNSKLIKGSWQNALLIELDGPRERRVIIEIIGSLK